MDAKYKIGELVVINRDNEMIDAEVFGIVNNTSGKPSYSLRVGSNFYFLDEDRIIGKTYE